MVSSYGLLARPERGARGPATSYRWRPWRAIAEVLSRHTKMGNKGAREVGGVLRMLTEGPIGQRSTVHDESTAATGLGKKHRRWWCHKIGSGGGRFGHGVW